MNSWNQLLQNVLIGTEKKPPEPANLTTDEELAPALQSIAGNTALDAEEQLLQATALLFNFRQAGQTAQEVKDIESSIAEAETLPYCSAAAKDTLRELFDYQALGLFYYWIRHCAAAKRIAPPELVPLLLQLAAKNPELRDPIRVITGKRGEWLAQLNPDWQESKSLSLEESWEQGTTDQRVAALRQQRIENPESSRLWLTESWSKEGAAVKQKLFEAFDTALSDADLPFLESCLKDKSQKVQQQVLELIRQIPESELVSAYAQVVRSSLVIRKEKTLLGLSSKLSWEAKTPVDIHPDWRKQGLDTVSNTKEFTDEEYILFQLLHWVPPTLLNELSGLGTIELIQALQKEKLKQWLPAIGSAAVRFRNQDWINTLAEQCDSFLPILINALPPAKQDAYAKTWFSGKEDFFIPVFVNRETEWPVPLARQIMNFTASNPYQYTKSFYQQHMHLLPFEAEQWLDQLDPPDGYQRHYWQSIKEEIQPLFDLKKRIQQSFNA
jgi:hypothetical protein